VHPLHPVASGGDLQGAGQHNMQPHHLAVSCVTATASFGFVVLGAPAAVRSACMMSPPGLVAIAATLERCDAVHAAVERIPSLLPRGSRPTPPACYRRRASQVTKPATYRMRSARRASSPARGCSVPAHALAPPRLPPHEREQHTRRLPIGVAPQRGMRHDAMRPTTVSSAPATHHHQADAQYPARRGTARR
jgi:hypothetical protein